MATADDIRATITTYGERFGTDREGWLDLFTADATVEDPVGTDVHRGREQIGAFWDFAHSLADQVDVHVVGPVCVSGTEAAFHIEIHSTVGDAKMLIPAIDAMVFDDDAKITQMRAYWTMEDLRPF